MRQYLPSGFTLIELLITVIVASVLLTLAIPSFQQALETNRIATRTNELVSSLQLARTQAVQRADTVSICGSGGGQSCNGNWEGGWIVFHDRDGDGDPDNLATGTCSASQDCLLRVAGTEGSNVEISGPSDVTYLPSGRIDAALTFNLEIPDCIGEKARDVTIAATGRPETTKTSC